jgi:hypothetical protein
MGRHSAPEDERDVLIAAPVVARPRPGRHARPDGEQPGAETAVVADKPAPRPHPQLADELLAEQATQRIDPVEQTTERIGAVDAAEPVVAAEPGIEPIAAAEPGIEPIAAAEPAPVKARAGGGNHSTAADLALLRESSELRARVIAAIVAPFVLYTAVLYLIGAMDVYFIWVWIPLVTAGVLAGSLLDAAHRRHSKPDS